jgi:hypothetical protein
MSSEISAPKTSESRTTLSSKLNAGLRALPRGFEPNVGQFNASVKFAARGLNSTVFLTGSDVSVALANPSRGSDGSTAIHRDVRGAEREMHEARGVTILRFRNQGINPNAEISGSRPLPWTTNYLIGRQPSGWHRGITSYSDVNYRDVYPGIDLRFHINNSQLESDYIVRPGANPAQIRLRVTGQTRMSIDSCGDLRLTTPAGIVRLKKPTIYQLAQASDRRIAIDGGFRRIASNLVGFTVGRHDHHLALVVDPILTYSTFVGGSGGSTAYSIVVDGQGDAYVAGSAQADFPTTPGSYQPGETGSGTFNTNAFISKINGSGGGLIYSTYIGGELPATAAAQTTAFSIAIDGQGNAYVAGFTDSPEFPIVNGYQSILKSAAGNAFVSKLNSDGTALIYSTYLGGSSGDGAYGISVDASGHARVVGTTSSADFPLVNPIQSTGTSFATELASDGSTLIYSTRLGGSGSDSAFATAAGAGGSIFVVGTTTSEDFPTTLNSVQPTFKGAQDAFLTEIDGSGKTILYSTLLGSSGPTASVANAVAVDGGGSVFVAGWTIASNSAASDFPTTPGAIETQLPPGNGAAFISKITPSSDGSSDLGYSTFLGATPRSNVITQANAIVLDSVGDAVVSGRTGSPNFPTTPGALEPSLKSSSGNFNAFVSRLNPSGSLLLYSTYWGGSVADQTFAAASGSSGNIFIVGSSQSPDLTTTTGAFQPNHLAPSGSADAFVTQLAVDDVVHLSPSALDFGNELLNQTSAPKSVTITNNTEGPLVFQSPPSISGSNAAEFSAVSSCGAQILAGQNCAITVTFAPSLSGQASAVLSFQDSDPSSPQVIPLAGTGITDFELDVPTTETASRNEGATFQVSVVPLGGSTQTVNLSCSGGPENAECLASPDTINLDGTHTQTTTITVQRNASSPSELRSSIPGAGRISGAIGLCIGFSLLVLAARDDVRKALALLVVMTCIASASCSKAGTSNFLLPGTYVLKVSGSSGSDTHLADVSLVVLP